MSATLSATPALTFHAKNIFETPAANGQFITLFASGKVALKRPNKLLAEFRGSAPHFDFFYNGSQVAAFAPDAHVYSLKPAPDSIDAMLAGIRAETGIRFVAAPLLTSDPYRILTRGLLSAIFVGPTKIDGVLCDHLAFRSNGVNWEIWLESNQRALPRRVTVTLTDHPNFPRTLVEFSRWNLRPWFLPDGAFDFHPPAGAHEIPFSSTLKSVGR